ncbi:putative gustatory receptor 59d [Drosophila subpulchrella]|uniref:putative gustatory receptor 59d n=1 Tax=Drosophila subpulchrella TaxID=1486046 RepID=UPI0018A155F6|nr:putative gustatory receptor 59d [Drosophila subpulchrella]
MCFLLTLASRWWNREEFMQVFDEFRRQYSPEILPYCRRRILSKILCATTVDTMHIVITMLRMRKHLTLSVALGTCGLFSTTVVVHVIIMQYFMAMASIRGRYILLNKELQALISETRSLSPNRIGDGVFITKCCSLADRFEKIAKSQSDLQAFIDRLTRVYEVQHWYRWIENGSDLCDLFKKVDSQDQAVVLG